MHRGAIGMLVLAAAVGISTAAEAHAFLIHANPPVGSTVHESPKEIRLYFSEEIEPVFSGIELATKAGEKITTGPASVDPYDRSQFFATLTAPLLPEIYRVSWHVVSVDTHRTEGDFSFEVKP
jgi:methionine-rich copper-binding protein CopC